MRIISKDGRTQLIADAGKVITDGGDVFGVDITLAVGADASAFREISKAEYDAKIERERADGIGASDYR